MRVLLLGGSGQLGQALRKTVPAGIVIQAPSRSELSLDDPEGIARAVELARPGLILNAAAYTAVDQAETEREQAFAVNVRGPAALARAAVLLGARMIHVSTDFVFDGEKSRPYLPEDPTNPLGVYGESKLDGETAVRAALPDRSLIVRTSWLYSDLGQNFVLTILRLLEKQDEVKVVIDQVGSPTSTSTLAQALWKWVELDIASGIRHFCDAGVGSWYDFAEAIREEASDLGLVGGRARVLPIRSVDFPTLARRPASSTLDALESWRELDLEPLHWRESLLQALSDYQQKNRG